MQATMPAMLMSLSTLRDGSIKLVFETQNLDAEHSAILFSLRNSLGWLVFAPSEEQNVVIPDAPPKEFKEQKTESQRLRAVLYLKFQRYKQVGEDFDSYYKREMNIIIEREKECL